MCNSLDVQNKFSKIYDTILYSTLWEEAPEARLVFLGMVFASDMDGHLMTKTKPALARQLNVTEEYLERGLAVLTAPDPASTNKEHEGRRVVPIEGGWLIVSKRAYIDKKSKSEWATKKAAWRAKRGLTKAEQMEVDRNDTISGIASNCTKEFT